MASRRAEASSGRAGLQDRQQGPGRGEQGVAGQRVGAGSMRAGQWRTAGRKRTREGVRRRAGVEHGGLRAGRETGQAGGAERGPPAPRSPEPPWAGWPDSRRRDGRRRKSRTRVRPVDAFRTDSGNLPSRRRSGPARDVRRYQPNRILPFAVKVQAFADDDFVDRLRRTSGARTPSGAGGRASARDRAWPRSRRPRHRRSAAARSDCRAQPRSPWCTRGNGGPAGGWTRGSGRSSSVEPPATRPRCRVARYPWAHGLGSP